jgi:hypothetical protein
VQKDRWPYAAAFLRLIFQALFDDQNVAALSDKSVSIQ